MAPAGNLSSLKAAAEAGADSVYMGFSGITNARNFEGLNFTVEDLKDGIEYLHKAEKKLYLAINTFAEGDNLSPWFEAVDKAVELGVDALILSDLAVLRYASTKYPEAELHLSVQASATTHEAINFFKEQFNIKRAVLPRVHTISEIRDIHEKTDVELEAFLLGGLCINVEGRCFLSSFVTGASTNIEGACSPSRFVRFEGTDNGGLDIRLNGTLLNSLGADESSPYPTCCKGRYHRPDGSRTYAMEEPESLNAVGMIPELIEAGITALKIEGRQRTKSYVREMTGVTREAVDEYYKNGDNFSIKPEWSEKILRTFEGGGQTFGAYGGK